MFEHSTFFFRIACWILAALVMLQIARVAARKDPLHGLSAPAAPRNLSAGTEAPTNSPSSQTPEKPAALPPATQAHVDAIVRSEIFGAMPKPAIMPVALLGIAGRDAFVRAPNGQTGLIREGEEFGGIKLLQLGTNRALIEHEGQKKELTMFSGFGGQPLLMTGKEIPQ